MISLLDMWVLVSMESSQEILHGQLLQALIHQSQGKKVLTGSYFVKKSIQTVFSFQIYFRWSIVSNGTEDETLEERNEDQLHKG